MSIYCDENRMRLVMNALGRNNRPFNMGRWRHPYSDGITVTGKHVCGTAMCIGGTAEAIALSRKEIEHPGGDLGDSPDMHSDRAYAVYYWLDMDPNTAEKLFFDDIALNYEEDVPERITVEQAKRACQNVIDNGDPDWVGVLGS